MDQNFVTNSVISVLVCGSSKTEGLRFALAAKVIAECRCVGTGRTNGKYPSFVQFFHCWFQHSPNRCIRCKRSSICRQKIKEISTKRTLRSLVKEAGESRPEGDSSHLKVASDFRRPPHSLIPRRQRAQFDKTFAHTPQ